MNSMNNNIIIENQLSSDCSTSQRSEMYSTLCEYNKLFEDQLNSINSENCEDSEEVLRNKIQIYEEWVSRLIEQNATLVECIEEMEKETAKRLDVLTKKLNETSLADERVKRLTSDLKTLLEIIRRARVNEEWSVSGLNLEYLTFNEIFGIPTKCDREKKCECVENSCGNVYTVNVEMNVEPEKMLSPIEKKECIFSSEHDINDRASNEMENIYKSLMKQNDLLMQEVEELKFRNAELEKTNINTKVLVDEVANRHDEIVKLKSENAALELQLKSQDKKMCYKDEIIKELRKISKKSLKKIDFLKNKANSSNSTTTTCSNSSFLLNNTEESLNYCCEALKQLC